MSLAPHTFDKEFVYVSKGLEKAISTISSQFEIGCDLPCGNGRNTFYLSKLFKEVYAIDISEKYLNEISEMSKEYEATNIHIIRADLLNETPKVVEKCDFLSCIHFYSFSSISNIIKAMKPDSFLYIETPNLHGENEKMLPTDLELKFLFKTVQPLQISKKSKNGKVSFSALIQKND